jgi:hypothetical protein
MKATMHICRTGDKEQFYTLYMEVIDSGKHWHRTYCHFVQNLAHKQADAYAKADEMREHIKARYEEVRIELHPQPRAIYSKFEAFGVEMKMAKSKKVWYGNINDEFWTHWKADKNAVSEAGFWIKKMVDESNWASWVMFRKVEAEEIAWCFE